MIPLIISLFLLPIGVPTQQYAEPLIIEQYIPKPLQDECFCVRTAIKYSPLDIPRQDAVDFEPNSRPVQGGLVLLKYWSEKKQHYVYHVAVILFIFPGGVWIKEGNYKSCQESERFIDFKDPHLRGFWSIENIS